MNFRSATRGKVPAALVGEVRRFNRFYTTKIGVLRQGLLESPFSLTEVRVLYELAHQPSLTGSALARQLGVDPGYLSRLLQGLKRKGLLRIRVSRDDARQNLLSLTRRGRQWFGRLDRRQNAEVSALLQGHSPAEQKRLAQAMGTIAQVLGGPAEVGNPPYILRPPQPGDMGWVVHRHGALYWQEHGYDERFEAIVAEIVAHFVKNFRPRRERCWIAERNHEIVGSIFLVQRSKTVAKLRLLLVEPQARGLGIGKRLVEECVQFARQAGYRKIVLWTQSELLPARALYQWAGFRLTAREKHKSWGRDHLVSETWELKL
ncbi:MAG: bifunctional helix-turn-helix transcriptional regulator/GNAT family N-acetyltransferase [Acidobacteria bacterium]|nr:bifunctional helix-turn-helix transcriptional regulator/GNAT family N-acetyltransferase [Acidobacteriota bacterium]